MGREVVQLAGTAIGSYFGPYGTAIGSFVGGVVGGALFPPPPIRGPRLNDFRVNNSQLGAPIRKIYGNARVAGDLIWLGQVRERERTETSGDLFGLGGQDVTTYEYYATFAMAVGEVGPNGADIRRIWANNRLIYSANALSEEQQSAANALWENQQFSSPAFFEPFVLAGAEQAYAAASGAAEVFESEVLTIYPGTETQEPDPTIQSYLGAENTPAFRGVCYVVFKDWNITAWGGALPNLEFEVVNGPSTSVMMPEWRNEVLYPWDYSATDAQRCGNEHIYEADITGGSPTRATLEEALADLNADRPAGAAPLLSPAVGYTVAASVTNTPLRPPFSGDDYHQTKQVFSAIADPDHVLDTAAGSWTAIWSAVAVGEWALARNGDGVLGLYYITDSAMAPSHPLYSLYFEVPIGQINERRSDQDGMGFSPERWMHRSNIGRVDQYREPTCPLNPCSNCFGSKPLLPDDPRFCIDPFNGMIYFAGAFERYESGAAYRILADYSELDAYPQGFYEEPAVPSSDDRYNDQVFWVALRDDGVARGILPAAAADWVYGVDFPLTVTSPTFKVLAQYDEGSSPSDEARIVAQYPLGPCVPQWSQSYNDQAFWEAAYQAQRDRYLATGATEDFIPGSLTYTANGTGDYPKAQTFTCARFPPERKTKTALPITAGEIVDDISGTVGLLPSQVDTAALTKTLWGYVRDRVMTGRDAVEQLRAYAFFDAVESSDLIRFVVRGGAAVATLDADELGAFAAGEQPPPAVVPTRTSDLELPAEVRINYLEYAGDYQGGTQSERRITAGEQAVLEVSLNITGDASPMKRIAQAMLYDAWASRNAYQTSVLREWMALEPTDPILVPVDSQVVRMRVQQVDHDPRGLLRLRTVREDADAFVASAATGIALPGSSDVHPVLGITQMVLIDAAALNASADDAGVYVASRGFTPDWPGAQLYVSTDGATYSSSMALASASVIGVVPDVLGTGPYQLWDDSNTLTVQVRSDDELLSAADLDVMTGTNRAFVGAADRWEIVGWGTATLIEEAAGVRTYALTHLLRGANGTEWARSSHVAGDAFVRADTVRRLALTASSIGTTLQLKAVTVGTAVDAAGAVPLIPGGVALKPWAPTLIEFQQVESGMLVTWLRRTRFDGEMVDGIDVPLNEEFERYEYEAVAGAGAAVTGTVDEPQVILPLFASLGNGNAPTGRFGVTGGVLYFVTDSSSPQAIHALDATTYERINGMSLGNDAKHVMSYAVQGGYIYVAIIVSSGGSNVSGLRRIPPEAVLTNDPNHVDIVSVGISNIKNFVFLGSDLWVCTQTALLKYNPTTMAQTASISLSADSISGLSVSTDGTDLYVVGLVSGAVGAARYQTDGTLVWSVTLPVRFLYDVLAVGDYVWALGLDGLIVLDVATGDVVDQVFAGIQSADQDGPRQAGNPGQDRIRFDGTYVTVPWYPTGFARFDPDTRVLNAVIRTIPDFYGYNGEDLNGAWRPLNTNDPLSITVWQISASVGRGYPATGSTTVT